MSDIAATHGQVPRRARPAAFTRLVAPRRRSSTASRRSTTRRCVDAAVRAPARRCIVAEHGDVDRRRRHRRRGRARVRHRPRVPRQRARHGRCSSALLDGAGHRDRRLGARRPPGQPHPRRPARVSRPVRTLLPAADAACRGLRQARPSTGSGARPLGTTAAGSSSRRSGRRRRRGVGRAQRPHLRRSSRAGLDDASTTCARAWPSPGSTPATSSCARRRRTQLIGYNWLKVEGPTSRARSTWSASIRARRAGPRAHAHAARPSIACASAECSTAALYVDADNAAAVHLYRRSDSPTTPSTSSTAHVPRGSPRYPLRSGRMHMMIAMRRRQHPP